MLKKKTKCTVCGYRFIPEKENIKTVKESKLFEMPKYFDVIDCPQCGCQKALAARIIESNPVVAK